MKRKTRAELEVEAKQAISLYKKAKRRADKAEADLDALTRDMNSRLAKFCQKIRMQVADEIDMRALVRANYIADLTELRSSWEVDDDAIIAKARGVK